MNIATAKLFSSEHWVLSLSCRLQPSEAGAAHGIFVAVANQSLLRLQLDRRALKQAGRAGSNSRGKSSSSSSSASQPVSFALRSNSPGGLHSSTMMPAAQLPHNPARTSAAAQDISVFAVQFVAMELAVLTLAYDGCCRLHSAVDGGLRCCWRSPGGSRFTAMGCTELGTRGEALLGDERGMLHIYSLASQQLLATKQLAQGRLEAIIVCGSTASGNSSSNSGGSGSSSSSSSTRFAVLSAAGLTLWQLRRGLSHGILPGGHKAAVLAVQVCRANVQVALPELLAAADVPAAVAAAAMHTSSCGDASNSSPATTARGGSSSAGGSSPACVMLVSGGLDSRVLQWDLAGGPSVLASLDVERIGSELSAVTYLQGWSILVTGGVVAAGTSSHVLLGPSHGNTVCCLAPVLTAKGDELLLSGSYDGCVSLWEPRNLRGVKPHLLARFKACGLTPAALLEACSLAQLPGAAAGSTSAGPGSSAADTAAAAAAAAAARRRKAAMSASRGMGAAGAAAAASHSCSPMVQGSPGPVSGAPALAGAQRLANIGGSSGSYSLKGVVAQAGQPGPRFCSYGCSGGSWSPKTAVSCTPAVGLQHNRWEMDTGAAAAGVTGMGVEGGSGAELPEVLAVLFDSSKQLVITAGNSGAIRAWSGSCAGELLGQHLGHTGPVNCLALDGNFLFSGSNDKTIRMWDVLPPHFAGVSGATASSSSGAMLRQQHAAAAAAAGQDGRLLQWDCLTGQLLARQQLHGQELLCLAVRQDSRQVYAGSSTAQLLSFQLIKKQPAEEAELQQQTGQADGVAWRLVHTALCSVATGMSSGGAKLVQCLMAAGGHVVGAGPGSSVDLSVHTTTAALLAARRGRTVQSVLMYRTVQRGTVQLPRLKAASFSSSNSTKLGASAGNGTLQDIAAFAPNLEQLYCQCLEIDATSITSNGSNATLPHCTHFGGQELYVVGAASRAAGGAAFARAFPELRVITCLPHTIKIAAEQKHHGKWSMGPGELLALHKSIHAVRGCGAHAARALDSTSSCNSSIASRVAQLAAVTIHTGMSSSSTLPGVVAQLHQAWSIANLQGLVYARHAAHSAAATPASTAAAAGAACRFAVQQLL
ncbi:hypothetical protein COO60DRAFT_1640324 [Scenedesmus sp. NREL 46B-D3]|nr:hypothetical protein COO60DRAFT_1640324 [Scenedesmus sp. NREL 46B-D3]